MCRKFYRISNIEFACQCNRIPYIINSLLITKTYRYIVIKVTQLLGISHQVTQLLLLSCCGHPQHYMTLHSQPHPFFFHWRNAFNLRCIISIFAEKFGKNIEDFLTPENLSNWNDRHNIVLEILEQIKECLHTREKTSQEVIQKYIEII